MRNYEQTTTKTTDEAIRTELDRMAEAGERPPAPASSADAGRTGRRTQDRKGEDEDEPDPPPSQRQLYDRLLTAINSGTFSYHLILRTPTPSPANGSPSFDPGAQEHLGEEIARSLAAEDSAAIVCGSFQSVNTQKQNPHFHCLLSKRPSYRWARGFREDFGPRSVHVVEIGPKPQDAAKVAYYIARQSVSVSVAHPRGFARSEQIGNAAEDKAEASERKVEADASAAPVALVVSSPRQIPHQARQVELGLLRPRPPP